jgi:hypothetical protein
LLLYKLTTKVYKGFEGWKIMKEKTKDCLDNIAEHSFRIGSGLAVGAFDVWTSGLPLVTSWLLLRYVNIPTNYSDFKLGFTDTPSWLCIGEYVLGNAIPFAIKYRNEISNFVEGVLK